MFRLKITKSRAGPDGAFSCGLIFNERTIGYAMAQKLIEEDAAIWLIAPNPPIETAMMEASPEQAVMPRPRGRPRKAVNEDGDQDEYGTGGGTIDAGGSETSPAP